MNNMIDSKFIGGVLLIVGTSIGGGMLALPLATAAAGILNSSVLLIFFWLVMTSGALLMLEVCSRLPRGSNMISMAQSTLGYSGKVITFVLYLFLLYSLISGYISGGSDVFRGLLSRFDVSISHATAAISFTVVFGLVIDAGIQAVDWVNRGLMFGKLGIYLLLLVLISPHLTDVNWSSGVFGEAASGVMVLVTSFGFASIVPSLRDYFENDLPKLRLVILCGSLIPLVCYLAWDAVIMGVLQIHGQNSQLMLLAKQPYAITGLNALLRQVTASAWIDGFFGIFTSICMLTAFLGVSIGLFDFLADGFQLKKQGLQRHLILFLTLVPPLVIVLFQPGIYLKALGYAGICCIMLLLFLPVLMAWRSREMYGSTEVLFLPGGKITLTFVLFTAMMLLRFATSI